MKRRQFVWSSAALPLSGAVTSVPKPAALGGEPVRKTPFPPWPVFDKTEEDSLNQVLKSGRWFRGYGRTVDKFEEEYARLTGARYCLATANGTSALMAAIGALGIGPGDEVIVPPYTFVATINAVLMFGAMPVFVDSDPETSQIDARLVEAAITDRTAAIMPVHLGGSAADLDTILAVAKKRNLPVIEDACQSHLGEWRNRKVGSYGIAGCFSFQASKNLNSGEGGAILTSDDDFLERCYVFHNNGRGRKTTSYTFSYGARGANLRLTEFQAALLLAQMTRLEEQSKTRERNAGALTAMLNEIPGISPAKMYPGCTRNAYHLYMFRYKKEEFAGLPRAKFLKALSAEGIPASGGYAPLNKEPFLQATFETRGFRRVYDKAYMDRWRQRNSCPKNDRLCEEAVWLTQNMLLGPREDMEQIAEAVRKIRAHADQLMRS